MERFWERTGLAILFVDRWEPVFVIVDGSEGTSEVKPHLIVGVDRREEGGGAEVVVRRFQHMNEIAREKIVAQHLSRR